MIYTCQNPKNCTLKGAASAVYVTYTSVNPTSRKTLRQSCKRGGVPHPPTPAPRDTLFNQQYHTLQFPSSSLVFKLHLCPCLSHIQFATTARTSEIYNCWGTMANYHLVNGNHWSGLAPPWGPLCAKKEPQKPPPTSPPITRLPQARTPWVGGVATQSSESPEKSNRCGTCSWCPLGGEGCSRNRPYK